MKQGIAFLIVLIVIAGCTAGRNEAPPVALGTLKVGETVYVCGCPMLCCNSITRVPGGRCACNQPLKRAKVSAIQNRVLVKLDDGREKRFFIKNR